MLHKHRDNNNRGDSHRRFSLVLFAAACGLSWIPARAAQILVDSKGNVDRHLEGGNNPRKTGNYRLLATALDSLAGAEDREPKGPTPYSGTADKPNTDNTTASRTGDRFAPMAFAQINERGPGVWNTDGSDATPGVGPKPKSDRAETYKALAQITDPWSFDVSATDFTLTEMVTFAGGLTIQALATEGASADASISAGDSTDLNGLGQLWTFDWSTDSTHPGILTLRFWSNPALGLDDGAITSGLFSHITSSSLTGASTFTSPFTFSYNLTIPANTQPQFTGDTAFQVNGAAPGVPEPSTAALFAIGITFAAFGQCRRRLAQVRARREEGSGPKPRVRMRNG